MTPRRALARSLAALAVCACTASALATTASAGEIRGRGPMMVRGQFPLDLVTLDMTPASAAMPERGTARLDFLFAYSNSFEITPAYDARVAAYEGGTFPPGWDFNVDAETARGTLSAEFQIARRFSLGLEAPLLSHGGGFMDSMIESVHEALGLPQNDRDLKEQDQINIDLLGGTVRQRMDSSETGFGDVTLRGRVMLWDGDTSAVTAVVEVKAPTGELESFTGSGEWDYGLTLLLTAGSDRHHFHGGLSGQVLGQPETWPFEIEDRIAGFAGYEWSPNERWSLAMHVMAATSLLPEQTGYDQDGMRADIVAGFTWAREMFRLRAGFMENLTTNDNSQDLSLFFGAGWEFGGR